MHDQYKNYRHNLRQCFRSFPTMESALVDPPENMEKEVWRFLCEKWSDKDYKLSNPEPRGDIEAEREREREKMGGSTSDDFSVVVSASDLGIDARPFLSSIDGQREAPPQENWHDCPSDFLSSDNDFFDLDALHFFRLERGSDKSRNRIFRIVGKYFPGLGIPPTLYSDLRGIMRLLQGRPKSNKEQRRINEELVERIQILESDRREYNAKVDFLMQQISRRGPFTGSS